jgi:GNAT superfamily N-acetyltransferase
MPDMTGPAETDPHEPSGPDRAARLTVGERVVVRHLLPPGSEAGAADVLGILVSRDSSSLVIDTRRGRVTVPRATVVAAKEVPPPPSRPGPAHLRVSADDLELLMARGWVPTEQEALGSWLLRSAPGFTQRANSALPAGDPSVPLGAAIEHVERWYAERGQATRFQLPGQPGFEPAAHPVGAALLERGYSARVGGNPGAHVRVLTAPLGAIPRPFAGAPTVRADTQLSPEWVRVYGQSREIVPGVTEQVLTGSHRQLFLSVTDVASDNLVGIARMASHPGWAGIFGLWVDPAHRRRGIASAIVSAVGRSCLEQSLRAVYLQVSETNTGALAFWEELGFVRHHDYTYLTRAHA